MDSIRKKQSILDPFFGFIGFWMVIGPERYWRLVFNLILLMEKKIKLLFLVDMLKQKKKDSFVFLLWFFAAVKFVIGLVLYLSVIAVSSIIFIIIYFIFWASPFLFVFNLFITNQ